MTPDVWSTEVRRRLALGRLLPLGEAADGAWVTERAAGAVLRAACASVPGLAVTSLRLALADPAAAGVPVVPPPPSGLPPGEVGAVVEVAVWGSGRPRTEGVREAMLSASSARLGLRLSRVDIRVTSLLDAPAPPTPPPPPPGARPGPPLAVPGVAFLTAELGVLPECVEVGVAAGYRAVEVVRGVRGVVGGGVAVLVTWVG
ncbi:nucleopolyhedrovirus P10 family protein [Streptomyces sp. BPTC-684]|uniref:nucleopolyhedrovirus P10 family protein n=1 Tax=Streptomyces sp. BPTC-684 TaxID=3043734 RepID=UPI0024B20682|nr:nucleopolyhedrovirus P10 family protein [Streptomyces sp. BPTC-684]WHM39362.1 nucleopolyhedrovirus P10 family protein [Streptomyces sp. BPTC-684]